MAKEEEQDNYTSAIIWGIAIVLVQVYYYEGYIATVDDLNCRIGLLGDLQPKIKQMTLQNTGI